MRLIPALLLFAACSTVDDATLPPPAAPPVPTASAPHSAPMTAPAPAPAPVPAATAYTASQLMGMSKADLRVARNTIFARHGRAFASEDLQQHFGAQSWYSVDPAYSDDRLTDAEKAQVALIASFETDRDPVSVYEFSGTPRIMFPEAGTAVVVPSDDMYEGMIDPVNASVHGDWVLTWGGPTPYNPSTAADAMLYQLDYDGKRVVGSAAP